MSCNIEFGIDKQDENKEALVIKLTSELNSLTSIYADLDLSNLISIIQEIIHEWDVTCQDSFTQNSLLEKINAEMSILVSKFELEKDLRLKEITKSFKIQDEAFQDNIFLQSKISDLSKKLNDCAANMRALENEKSLLIENVKIESNKYSRIIDDNEKMKQTISMLSNKLDILQNDHVNRNTEHAWRHDKWVDDSVLTAYFSAMTSSVCNRQDIIFLGPSETHLLKLSKFDKTKEYFPFLQNDECRFIFCCLNDSGSEAPGTHWSLLFCDRGLSKAFHFDSLNNKNLTSACMLATNLEITVDNVLTMPCYQQSNTFECGINVLVNAKHILHHYCLSKCNMSFDDWYLSCNNECTTIKNNNDKEIISCKAIQSKPNSQKKVSKRLSNEWTLQQNKKKRPSSRGMVAVNKELKLRNSFSVLENDVSQHSENINNPKGNNLKGRKVLCGHVNNKSNRVGASKKPQSSKQKVMSIKKTCHTTTKKSEPLNKSILIPKPQINKILLLSDSHGRYLSHRIQEKLQNLFLVSGIVKPNATFKCVMDGCDSVREAFTKNDCVIVLAGTNNIPDGCDGIRATLNNSLKKFENTNVLVMGIPRRFDVGGLNLLISDVNTSLSNTLKNHPNASFISTESIPRSCFTRHGLHMNAEGKRRIVDLMVDAVLYPSKQVINHKKNVVITSKSAASAVDPILSVNEVHLGIRKPENVKNSSVGYNNKQQKQKERVWYNTSFNKNNQEHNFSSTRVVSPAVGGRAWANSVTKKPFLGVSRSRAQIT